MGNLFFCLSLWSINYFFKFEPGRLHRLYTSGYCSIPEIFKLVPYRTAAQFGRLFRIKQYYMSLTTRQAAFKMNVSIESVRNYILRGVKSKKSGEIVKLKATEGLKGTKKVWAIEWDDCQAFMSNFLGE